MIDRVRGGIARTLFRAVKGEQLRLVRCERRSKRQALGTMRRAYRRLCAEFLRVEGTTYGGWLEHGPKAEWEECLAAAHDDALWDRLVERGLA